MDIFWIITFCTFSIAKSQDYIGAGICQEPGEVCASLIHLEMNDTFIPETNPYCACIDCDTTWSTEPDDRSFTWYHYNRHDWKVQYKMCIPFQPTNDICTSRDAVGALITSPSDRWFPKLTYVQCKCKNGVYNLAGWSLIQESNRWEYYYTCNMPVCNITDTCVQKYNDPDNKRPTTVEFSCTCPPQHTCEEVKEKPLEQTEGDFVIPDIVGYCKKVHKKNF